MYFCRRMEKEVKEEMIKRSIIEDSKKVFQKYGYYKVTMDDISKATKKARSTLYYYFKDKGDVFNAVMNAEIKELLDNLEESISKETTAAEKFAALVLNKYKFFKPKIHQYSLVMGELHHDETVLHDFRKTYIKREIALLNSIMKEGIKKREFIRRREEDIAFLAESFVLGFQAIERYLSFEDLKIDYIPKLKLHVEILLKGLS